MDVSLREAAALLGRSPRAVRAKVARGELRARKVGKKWSFSSHDLPLTEPQRQALTQRLEIAARALAAVAPPNLATTRNPDRRRSVRDLAAFTTLRTLTRSIRDRAKESPNLAAAGVVEALGERQDDASFAALREVAGRWGAAPRVRRGVVESLARWSESARRSEAREWTRVHDPDADVGAAAGRLLGR